MSESPSFLGRVRAGFAAALARLSSGAHRLEEWTARGSRTTAIVLVAVVMLAVGAILMATEGRAVAGWFHGGHGAERQYAGRPPGPDGDRLQKPDGGRLEKPHGGPLQKPDGKPEGKPAGKPHAPPPPPPPPAPATP